MLNGVVVDGAGWAPHAGVRVEVTISDELRIRPVTGGGPLIVIAADCVTELMIQGKSAVRGTRLIGGGFGLVGAATGIAAASAINAATRRKSVWTLIHIDTGDGFLTFQVDQEESQIRQALRKFRDATIEAHATSHVAAESEDLVGQLERLAAMHNAGSIDDGEFKAAKLRLLGS